MEEPIEASIEAWQTVYQLANQVKEANPWPWFAEDSIWGLQNPETGELGFVNLNNGTDGCPTVALYLGADALYDYLTKKADGATSAILEQINSLQLSFQNRDRLKAKDLAIIKRLGLKYRGKQAWPLVRNHQQGKPPWFLTAVDVQFLTCALQQLLYMSQQQQANPAFVPPMRLDTAVNCWLCLPGKTADVWQTVQQSIEAPPPKAYYLQMDRHALMRLKLVPLTNQVVDIDFFWTPTLVKGDGERPFYSYVLMLVDPKNSFILTTDAFIANPDMEALWSMIPMRVVQVLARLKIRPHRLRVMSGSLAVFLHSLESHLGCTVEEVAHLPELVQVRNMLFDRL